MTVLISVWGASPGAGKSTLCAGLCARLAAAGLRVGHFREEEIMTRPQFAAVARELRVAGAVGLDTLTAATTRFVEAILAAGDDVVVADALVPFVPSLLAWGHSSQAIDAFTDGLAEVLAPVGPVLVYLDGSAETGLERAARRDGQQWLDAYVSKLARYRVHPSVHDPASAARYLAHERAVTLAVVQRQGWGLVLVEHATEMTPDQVLQIAERELRPWTGTRQP